VSAGPFRLLANPHAGRGRALQILHRVVAGLRAAGADAEGGSTRSTSHATELAADTALHGAVSVAVGGDPVDLISVIDDCGLPTSPFGFSDKYAALQAVITMRPITFHLQVDGVANDFTGGPSP
jgi:hypothetical protein